MCVFVFATSETSLATKHQSRTSLAALPLGKCVGEACMAGGGRHARLPFIAGLQPARGWQAKAVKMIRHDKEL